MNNSVIVLNQDFTYLNNISWKKAIKLITKGKAEVFKESEIVISSGSTAMFFPIAIRLLEMINSIFKHKIPFSKKNIFFRDDYICQYCGKKVSYNTAELEHILPTSRGGKNTWENCVCSCSKCNRTKDNKTPEEAGMRLLSEPKQLSVADYISLRIQREGISETLSELFI